MKLLAYLGAAIAIAMIIGCARIAWIAFNDIIEITREHRAELRRRARP